MSDASSRDSATAVAEQLRVLFAEVVAADLDVDRKGRWHQRLIAITNTSKHDVSRAVEQLDRFTDEWNALQRGKGIDER